MLSQVLSGCDERLAVFGWASIGFPLHHSFSRCAMPSQKPVIEAALRAPRVLCFVLGLGLFNECLCLTALDALAEELLAALFHRRFRFDDARHQCCSDTFGGSRLFDPRDAVGDFAGCGARGHEPPACALTFRVMREHLL